MNINILYIEHYVNLHNYISDNIYKLDDEIIYTEGIGKWLKIGFTAIGISGLIYFLCKIIPKFLNQQTISKIKNQYNSNENLEKSIEKKKETIDNNSENITKQIVVDLIKANLKDINNYDEIIDKLNNRLTLLENKLDNLCKTYNIDKSEIKNNNLEMLNIIETLDDEIVSIKNSIELINSKKVDLEEIKNNEVNEDISLPSDQIIDNICDETLKLSTIDDYFKSLETPIKDNKYQFICKNYENIMDESNDDNLDDKAYYFRQSQRQRLSKVFYKDFIENKLDFINRIIQLNLIYILYSFDKFIEFENKDFFDYNDSNLESFLLNFTESYVNFVIDVLDNIINFIKAIKNLITPNYNNENDSIKFIDLSKSFENIDFDNEVTYLSSEEFIINIIKIKDHLYKKILFNNLDYIDHDIFNDSLENQTNYYIKLFKNKKLKYTNTILNKTLQKRINTTNIVEKINIVARIYNLLKSYIDRKERIDYKALQYQNVTFNYILGNKTI